MTSTASQQNPNPAPTNAPAATSYASAAGATKKQTSSAPLIATGSHPVVVASSAPAAQNGKPSAQPVNGRPPIPPAVPVSGPPSIARGTTVANGGSADHSRKSSVTITSNGPSIPNSGSSKAIPKFGFQESPAISHSVPQAGAVPIPIPGGSGRIPSPAHSPSPIPQVPMQSGGGQGQRQPSNAVPPPTFGSFPNDADVSV